ncbi:class I SAM-dependent methyltransferase [Candidatus Azambacteria bacterium]|nr:class I SAM-dependent methyltransferase [Candidatus Azambacteria bacterium]
MNKKFGNFNTADFIKKIFSRENKHLKKRIFSNQFFTVEKTENIWQKYFRFIPLKLQLPLKKYGLDKKKVLDVGSAWGEFLIHFGSGSKGIEINEKEVNFSRALGLDVSQYNIEDEWREAPESFDAIWFSNVLEHVAAPHAVLRNFHKTLKPDSLLFVRVPTIPSNFLFICLNRIFLGFLGFEAKQHINAFTRRTLEFTIKRAGFEIVESNIFLPPIGWLSRLFNFFLKDAFSFITVVARKKNFDYSEKRPLIHNPKWI